MRPAQSLSGPTSSAAGNTNDRLGQAACREVPSVERQLRAESISRFPQGLVDKIARPAAQRYNLWEPRARSVGSDFVVSSPDYPPTQPKRSRNRQKCGPAVSLTTLSRPFPQNANSFPHTDNRFSNNSNATSQLISGLRCGRSVQVHIGNLEPRYRNDIRMFGTQIPNRRNRAMVATGLLCPRSRHPANAA